MTEHSNTAPAALSPPGPLPDEQLPPYSGDNVVCVKCGFAGASTQHRATGEHGTRDPKSRRPSSKGERLERQCVRCGYAWDEAVSPPVTEPPGASSTECPGVHRVWVLGDQDDLAPDIYDHAHRVSADELGSALEASHDGWALDLSTECAQVMAEWLLQRYRISRLPAGDQRDAEAPDRPSDDDTGDLVMVGWYCWRCHNVNADPCRSDCVPVHVPGEWAGDMERELERRESGDFDEDSDQPALNAEELER